MNSEAFLKGAPAAFVFKINIHTFVIHKSINSHVQSLTEIEGSVIIYRMKQPLV